MAARILIVEDDIETLLMLEAFFERAGYEVVTAPCGEEAVAQATATPPDLVILDIRLPDIDGYEVCRRLREQQRTSQVPIVFLTEKRERASKIAGLQLGAVDYITKPFDMHELRLRVENALRRAGFRPLDHPVTGLPGEALLLEHLQNLKEQGGWSLTAIELEGLKEFDERYGFVARDDMLRAVALRLRAIADEHTHPAGYLAHVDTASFYLVTSAERAGGLVPELSQRLRRLVVQFYPRKDRESAGPEVPRVQMYVSTLLAGDYAVGSESELLKLLHEGRQRIATVP